MTVQKLLGHSSPTTTSNYDRRGEEAKQRAIRNINIPLWPTKDSTFSINLITLLQQFVEMVEMQSQASYGRVPTGKASAFRTTGTTTALLGQSDSRAEQVLRRAFGFFQSR